MKRRGLAILIVVLYGLTAAAFWVTSVKTLTIYPSMDSYGWQSVPNANNGGSNNFEITSYDKPPNNMRGWIVFNIPRIPSDAWILNAKLRLRIWYKTTNDPAQHTGDSTGRMYGVYRLTEPWAEYNITWANQPNYTKVHHASAGVPPGQSGWDGPLLWMEWDVTDIVKDWESGINNYGFLVRDTQEDSPILYSTQFFTHDQVPNEGYFPRLIVTYVAPQFLAVLGTLFLAEGFFIIVYWLMKARPSNTSRAE